MTQPKQPAQQSGQQPGQSATGQGQEQQALQAALQLHQEAQRAGFDVGTLFSVLALLRKYGPTLTAIAQELGSLFGGGAAPEGQAQAKK